MTEFLVRTFVKNFDQVKDLKVRQKYGMLSGIVGIVCNLLLFLFKFFAGWITGAVSISADAFNNLSDAGSSIITFVGFKMAGKPADPDHPFGHGRIEYVSGLIVAGAILLMGYELLSQSIDRIIHPEDMTFQVVSVVILFGSILVKLWLCLFNRKLGKRIDSAAMMATATDSLSDCISTGVVVLSLAVTYLFHINIDGYAGCVVAVFVLLAGVEAAKDTIAPLLGQAPEKEFVLELERIVTESEYILGIHDLIVHDYGPGRVFASLHAEVPADMDMLKAHDIIDLAEEKIKQQLGCDVSIHMDPVVVDDEQVDQYKKMVKKLVREIDDRITIHDFRITKGPYLTNLIFDIVVPFDCCYRDEEVSSLLKQRVREADNRCLAVIHIDKPIAGLPDWHLAKQK